MRNLSNLKPDECLMIASLVEPDKDWKLVESKFSWNGFDMIYISDIDGIHTSYIFQIDYRFNTEMSLKSRFRLYDGIDEYPISNLQLGLITNYLDSIGVDYINNNL